MKKSLCFILILGLFSCSVKKRNYRSGYYIDWAFAKHKTSAEKIPGKKAIEPQKPEYPAETEKAEILYADAANKFSEVQPKILPEKKNEDCNDSIFFRKGDVVRAKVFEINEKQVKYKRCDNFDGPSIIVNKNDIERVRYSNGMVEKFEVVQNNTEVSRPAEPVKKEIPNSAKRVHPLITWGIVIFVLSLVINVYVALAGLAAALVMFYMGDHKIKKFPDRYKGRVLGKVFRIITWILFILVLLVVLATL